MKNLIKFVILIVILAILLTSCIVNEADLQKRKEKVYFLNENFVIIKIKAKADKVNDKTTPAFVKIWLVQRINSNPDSILCAELSSVPESSEDFRITNELWYNKDIGDTLHFKYIRKNRFFRVIQKPEVKTTIPTVVNNTYNITLGTVTEIAIDKKFIELDGQIANVTRALEETKALLDVYKKELESIK